MARPSPEILLTHILDKRKEKVQQVVTGTGMYIVLYKGKEFNLRTYSPYEPINKYLKTTFVNAAPAFGLADKLNRTHKTTDFTVAIPTGLKQIERKDYVTSVPKTKV